MVQYKYLANIKEIVVYYEYHYSCTWVLILVKKSPFFDSLRQTGPYLSIIITSYYNLLLELLQPIKSDNMLSMITLQLHNHLAVNEH